MLRTVPNVPEIIAKSASILAQVAWSTRFQVGSTSASMVTTATSRMTEATQTLSGYCLVIERKVG